MSKPDLAGVPSAEAVHLDLLLVPLGSVEQHGPHLPLSTDSLIATEVCGRVVEEIATQGVSAAVAPCVEYGSSGEHEGFAGTISIGHDALRALLVEMVRSARRWADRVVLVSGHGGNVGAMIEAVQLLRFEEPMVAWTTCAEPDFDAHAGHAETSMMLAVAPASVHLERAEVGNTTAAAELWSALKAGGIAAVAPNGVLGDPRTATGRDGERMLTALTRRVTAQISAMGAAGVDHSGALVRTRMPAGAPG
ncbi:mycofactocin biosynthesis peptidyl-dipeptidase MftE [Flexivirga lutea]